MGLSSQPVLDPLIGSTVGRYVVQTRVGEGGMGTVYRAEQTPLGRPVALKVIHRSLTSDQKVVSRFLREAKIACQLTNPHTVTIFDFGNEDGVLYLAMELLQGESLHERLCRGPVEPVRAAEIAAQVCRSLTEAHKKGIIHRDLKPDNIFLSTADDGSLLVKVLDYGLARVMSSDEAPGGLHATLTQIGTIVGTPIYMSPEQARGRKLDARTDLYSMGVVLFEMLSGVAPFLDEDAVVVLGKHIRDPVPRLAETGARLAPPAPLQVLVDKLLEKEPSKRPPDAAWVFQELRAYLAQTTSRSARMPAIEEPSSSGWLGAPAKDAPPARISPPEAASGVQPRVDESRDSSGEWDEETRARVAPPAPRVPDELPGHPTLRLDSGDVVLAEAPTIVPVAPRPSERPAAMPAARARSAPAPAPLDGPTLPSVVSPAPSLGAFRPAATISGASSFASRRIPMAVFVIAIPVVAFLAALVVLTLSRDDDAPEMVTATPIEDPGSLASLPGAAAPSPPLVPSPPAPGLPAEPARVDAPPAAPPLAAAEEMPSAPRDMEPREVPRGGWSGTYRTARGAVDLTEHDGLVTGRFGDGGRLEGRPAGSLLRFTWTAGDEAGHGVVRSFEGGGRVAFRGSFGAGDPAGVHSWRTGERTTRGKIRPSKVPATGLTVGTDDIFGTGPRTNRR